ncbi:Vgb family protein [Thermomonospora amylolytica]|uniref:Vgb family protein n=1 Tax=Thermomonospora amylolytica TaxID=1411117 RepID=UPI001F31D9E3|nr:hypothetical protein [Thermomonospora amylolytica]
MFHVHPRPQTAPLSVAAGKTSPLKPIDELVGTDASTGLDTMFIRVVKTGTGCAPSGAPDPGIKLKAGDGDPVEVPRFPETASIFNGPGGTGTAVADVTMQAEPEDVYLVRVFVFTRGSPWKIQLVNHDQTSTHAFTWVVADNELETRQPWIDAPANLTFDVEIGQTVTRRARIANLGTGTLTITDKQGTQPAPGFTLTTIPADTRPNACGDLEVTFTGPDTPGTTSVDYTVTGNDTTAQPTAGHNRQITLTAITRRLAPGTIVVTAKAGEPDTDTGIPSGRVLRVDPATGRQTEMSHGGLIPHPDAGVALEADGTILVGGNGEGAAGRPPGKIIRVDPATGEQAVVAAGLPPLDDLAIDADGTIAVLHGSDASTDRGILRVDPATGAQSVLTVGGVISGGTCTFDADRALLVAGVGGFSGLTQLVRVDPVDGKQTFLVSLEEPIFPTGVAVERAGGILVAVRSFDVEGGVIRIDPGTGAKRDLSRGGNLREPGGIAVEASGTILVCDATAFNEGGVIRVDPVSGEQTKVSAGGVLRNVLGIAVVPADRHR